jgi:hypothetical protein
VLHRRWDLAEGDAPSGAALGARRVAGSHLAALATGNVVTESAMRSASRHIRLAGGRVARTTVTASTGDWGNLPPDLLVTDLVELAGELDALPVRLIRPRVDAESVRVIAVGDVSTVRYDAGAQRLSATLTAPGGGTATVRAVHRSVAPAALDGLAAALAGAPRFVSGTVRRTRGGIVVTPLAVVTADAIIVPDLYAEPGDLAAAVDAPGAVDVTTGALDDGLTLLAEVAHRGARHLPPSFPDRLLTAARTLDRVGLRRCGGDLARLAGLLGPDPGAATVDAWCDAQIRLLATADQR